MFKRLTFGIVLLLAATTLFAGDPERRVVVVKDGNVVLDDFVTPGPRAYLGVTLVQLTPELREYFGAPKDAGVLVSSLGENSPASKAGIHVGDVILSVNGTSVDDTWDVSRAMRELKNGDNVRVEVLRGKAKQTIVATAEERSGRDMIRTFNLDRFERDFGPLPGGEWHARTITVPGDIEALRARIRELETKMRELQKRLDAK